MSAPSIRRWTDNGGRNRITLVRAVKDRPAHPGEIRIDPRMKDVTVIFTPEEQELLVRDILKDFGLVTTEQADARYQYIYEKFSALAVENHKLADELRTLKGTTHE